MKVRHYKDGDLVQRPDVPGARFWAVGLSHAMLTRFTLEPHASFPEHRHESEQITLVLSGTLEFRVGDDVFLVGPGEVIAVPGDVPHAVRALAEPVDAVDAWSPPRSFR